MDTTTSIGESRFVLDPARLRVGIFSSRDVARLSATAADAGPV
jgi:hypothetical protein